MQEVIFQLFVNYFQVVCLLQVELVYLYHQKPKHRHTFLCGLPAFLSGFFIKLTIWKKLYFM